MGEARSGQGAELSSCPRQGNALTGEGTHPWGQSRFSQSGWMEGSISSAPRKSAKTPPQGRMGKGGLQ